MCLSAKPPESSLVAKKEMVQYAKGIVPGPSLLSSLPKIEPLKC